MFVTQNLKEGAIKKKTPHIWGVNAMEVSGGKLEKNWEKF